MMCTIYPFILTCVNILYIKNNKGYESHVIAEKGQYYDQEFCHFNVKITQNQLVKTNHSEYLFL